jgi:hypothetical protein
MLFDCGRRLSAAIAIQESDLVWQTAATLWAAEGRRRLPRGSVVGVSQDLEQEPDTLLGLVDPVFEQAGGGDVVIFVTDVMQ